MDDDFYVGQQVPPSGILKSVNFGVLSSRHAVSFYFVQFVVNHGFVPIKR